MGTPTYGNDSFAISIINKLDYLLSLKFSFNQCHRIIETQNYTDMSNYIDKTLRVAK